MNKLISYSKIAGIITCVLLVIRIVLVYLDSNSLWLYNNILAVLLSIVWIVFFFLLIRASSKKSIIKTPSWIAIGGWSASIICSVCFAIAFGIYLKSNNYPVEIANVARVFDLLSTVLIAAAFIWISKYFSTGSLTKICAICIGVIVILLEAAAFANVIGKVQTNYGISAGHILNVIWAFLYYIPSAVFFFAFSKLKKQ